MNPGNKPHPPAVSDTDMLRPLSLVLCLCLAGAAAAQPALGHWPDRFTGVSRVGDGTLARMQPCNRPSRSVASGGRVVVDVDSLDAFRQNTLRTSSPSASGTFTLSGDTLVYVANDSVDRERDVIEIEQCLTDSASSCSVREVTILIGRAGTRRTETVEVEGGTTVLVPLDVPGGELLCGSVLPAGDYEYARFREARFSGFVPGDTLRYRSSRGSGEDAFEVVLCNTFGTCDTTAVRFRVSGPRQTLPFFDDFSYAGPRPDPARWLEDDVFVNDAFGVDPPSYGVATLDGVDGGGRSYGEGLLDVDQLTTAPIDLSEVGGVDPVWVKYYLQVGGRGQAPEQTDRVITQFRRDDGAWVEQASLPGSRTSTSESSFRYAAIEVGPAFRHRDFQVRFLMRANAAGSFDNFNLDYVRVEQAPDSSRAFRDIALAERPPSPLAPYTRVPFSQYSGRAAELLRERLPVALWNHFPTVNNVSRTAVVAEDANGVQLLSASLLSGAQFNLEPGLSRFDNPIPPDPLAAYRINAGAIGAEGAARVAFRYELDIDRDQDRLPGILRNDTAETFAVIADEFAYDDGTAEAGLFNTRTGDRIAVRYELARQDTLRGLRLAFPTLNPADADRQLINFQVYVGPLGDPERAPDYERVFARPFFPSSVGDSVQALTTYGLTDEAGEPTELIIPAGEFYVGWQQGSDVATPVQVGVDFNNDNGGAIFTEFGRGWVSLPDAINGFAGSLILRPIFSDEAIEDSSDLPEEHLRTFRAYPNPTSGRLRLETDARDVLPVAYRATDVAGRRVATGAYAPEIDLGLAAGLYVVEVTDDAGAVVGRVRVVVR